jgi:hypothetical protein
MNPMRFPSDITVAILAGGLGTRLRSVVADRPKVMDLALGVNIAWFPSFTHHVTWAALWDFMQAFEARGVAAWDEFVESRKDRPYPRPEAPPEGEGLDKQRELEERYFSAAGLSKYAKPGGTVD